MEYHSLHINVAQTTASRELKSRWRHREREADTLAKGHRAVWVLWGVDGTRYEQWWEQVVFLSLVFSFERTCKSFSQTANIYLWSAICHTLGRNTKDMAVRPCSACTLILNVGPTASLGDHPRLPLCWWKTEGEVLGQHLISVSPGQVTQLFSVSHSWPVKLGQ